MNHSRVEPAGRIAYVDGRYVPHREARVHIEDRGFQFADSIYEVCAVIDGSTTRRATGKSIVVLFAKRGLFGLVAGAETHDG